MKKMWTYQWTLDPTELTEELISTFFDCTQGVISLAIELYRKVQVELIEPNCTIAKGEMHGPERITPALVRAIYGHFMGYCHEHVDALRSKDPRILWRYPDLRPPTSRLGTFGPKSREKQQATGEPGSASGQCSDTPEPPVDDIERVVINVAVKMAGEVSIDKAKAIEWIATIKCAFEKENLGSISENPREFFKRIEKRIRAHLKSKKYTSVEVKPAAEPEDLRNLFDGKIPAADILKRSGFTGSNSIFGHR
jgi:hypothetical protein